MRISRVLPSVALVKAEAMKCNDSLFGRDEAINMNRKRQCPSAQQQEEQQQRHVVRTRRRRDCCNSTAPATMAAARATSTGTSSAPRLFSMATASLAVACALLAFFLNAPRTDAYLAPSVRTSRWVCSGTSCSSRSNLHGDVFGTSSFRLPAEVARCVHTYS